MAEDSLKLLNTLRKRKKNLQNLALEVRQAAPGKILLLEIERITAKIKQIETNISGAKL